MATFVLIHGAGDTGWYWHLTEAELHARGHQTIAPDLPCDNNTASLDDYAATVADAAAGLAGSGDRGPVLRRIHRDLGGQPTRRGAAARAACRDDPGPRGEPGPVVDEHRLPAGHRGAGQARRRQDRQRRPGYSVLQRRSASAGRRGPTKRRARGILRGLGHALATGRMARRAHQGRSSAKRTGSSPPPSCGGSHTNAWAPSRTRFPAVIAPRSATPGN